MGSYRYRYLMEYVPVRFTATQEQEKSRRLVYRFKDGFCPIEVKTRLVEQINKIKNEMFNGNARVCFIPASSHFKTIRRYGELATYIEQETGCPCSIDTITKQNDEGSGYTCGKKLNPSADYTINQTHISGMNIILVDDVITRGQTFVCTADKLINKGAKEVVGLFVARTIHPDNAIRCA